MALKALIFDVDGTLADTERAGHRVAFNRAFAEAGLDWDWNADLYGKLLAVTGGKERMHYYVNHFRPHDAKPANFDSLVASLHSAKTRHYTELLCHGRIPLRPGVRRLLESARQDKIRLALATTTTPANVTALLKYSLSPDAESWFAVIGAGDVVAAKKPAPDIYHYVLERLGLSPSECMAFEDSENGLHAARAAGLKTVITINDYTRAQDFRDATIVLNHFGEPDMACQVLSGPRVNRIRMLDLPMIRQLLSPA